METILDTIPNDEENKKLEDLFLAIYFNDLRKVITFKTKYPAIYAKKEQYLIDGKTNFDLKNLTLFNQKIWFNRDYIEAVMPLVEKIRQQILEMLEFWDAEIGQPNSIKLIKYNEYWEYFFCDDPNDLELKNEIFYEPFSYFVEKGFREIDVKLRNRVECFDFTEVRKLLEQGAKADIDLFNDNDSSAFCRLYHEDSYLTSCRLFPEFETFENKKYKQKFEITSMWENLLGLAAHRDMLKLLDKYYVE